MTFFRCSLMVATQQNTVLARASLETFITMPYTPFGSGGHEGEPGFNGDMCEKIALHYLLGNGHRAFLPALMRFNQPDALSPFGAGGLNAYAYCSSDPVNYQDPSGRMAGRKIAGKLVGALAGAGDNKVMHVTGKKGISRKASRQYSKKIKQNKERSKIYNKQHADTRADYKELMKSQFNGYTQLPERYAKAGAKETSWLHEVYTKVYGGAPDPTKIELYRASSTSPWLLDTAWMDINLRHRKFEAIASGKRYSQESGYRRADLLLKQFFVNHHANKYIGTTKEIPGQIVYATGDIRYAT